MSAVTVIAVFGAGIASFLAPCVAPLVPAYLAMVSGTTRADRPAGGVTATLMFVAGFSLVFAGFGALAGLLGASFGSWQLWVERIGGAVVIAFGLTLLGGWRVTATAEWHAIKRLPATGARLRPLVVGVAFGAAWTPCVGPLLGASLVLAARSASIAEGSALLLAYALGVGVPFLAASLALAAIPSLGAFLRRAGAGIEKVSGGLLVALGLLLIIGRYGWISSRVAELIPRFD